MINVQIEGFFSNIKSANETVKKLRESGFKKSAVDINDHYVDHRNIKTNIPGTETSVSLSGLVMESGSDGISRYKELLSAASSMISGLGRFDEIFDVNCKVIVNHDGDVEIAKEIIAKMGGSLDSPNFEKPEIENDYAIRKAFREVSRDLS